MSATEMGTPGTPLGSPTQPITHHFHTTPDHASVALQAMNKLRANSQLCDIELVAGAASVFAHRVVLAAASAYFHVMFNYLDSLALQLLVEYSYTGDIIITEDNVQVLLPASSLLQMSSVREACCKFLMRQLHPSNCLGIRSFADAHSCGELHTRSHKFALQNFPEVCGTEEFLLLPYKQVEELISSPHLNVPCEEKVFTAVISWVKHDLPARQKHVPELLKYVRLPLLSRDFLTSNVDAEPLVRENASCHHLLLEALKYHLLPEQRAVLASPRTQERQPDGVKPYLFACGGGSLFAIHSEVECYNPRTDRWMPVASMNYRRSRAGVTSLGRYLYVMGGLRWGV
ncbi:hypothetical protein O3P69_009358 [Scylla paramamosain]|uniref:BTB domain-containing protein n=1 Tax=Scylla paramamosain TaxID=85552 RepID=A0AAW0TA44_SCYPA